MASVVKHDRVTRAALAAFDMLVIAFSIAIFCTMALVALRSPAHALDVLDRHTVVSVILRTAAVCTAVAIVVVVGGYLIAFTLYTSMRRRAGVVLALILVPYVCSYYFLLLGWRAIANTVQGRDLALFGYGMPALFAVLVIRHLPVAVLLIYLRLNGLPLSRLEAASNLGVTRLHMHVGLYVPWAVPSLYLVFIFVGLFVSLDALAASVVGGGAPLLGNLIEDLHQSQDHQGVAMLLGMAYAGVLFLVVLGYYTYSPQRGLPHSGSDSASHSDVAAKATRGGSTFAGIALLAVFFGAQLAILAAIVNAARPFGLSAQKIIENGRLHESLLVTVAAATVAALVSTSLATLSVFAKHTSGAFEKRGGSLREYLIMLPLAVPPLLLAVASALMQGQILRSYGSAMSLTALYILVYGPLAYFLVQGSTTRLSTSKYQAAANLGIGKLGYFRTIFARQALPGFVAAVLLVFAFCINDSILAAYVAGFDRTLGVLIREQQVAAVDNGYFLIVLLMPCATVLLFIAGRWIYAKARF